MQSHPSAAHVVPQCHLVILFFPRSALKSLNSPYPAPSQFSPVLPILHLVFPSLPSPIHANPHSPMPGFTSLIWQLQPCLRANLAPHDPPHPPLGVRMSFLSFKSDEYTPLPETCPWLPFSCKMCPSSPSRPLRCSYCPPLDPQRPPLPISHFTGRYQAASFLCTFANSSNALLTIHYAMMPIHLSLVAQSHPLQKDLLRSQDWAEHSPWRP